MNGAHVGDNSASKGQTLTETVLAYMGLPLQIFGKVVLIIIIVGTLINGQH